MDKKRSIGIRISHQRLEAMVEVCDTMLASFRPANEHQELLHEYLGELKYKLVQMSKKSQELYTLTLSGTEAMAFYQLCQLMDVKHDRYASVIIESMLSKIGSLAA